jgi:phosphonate transport system permease protein
MSTDVKTVHRKFDVKGLIFDTFCFAYLLLIIGYVIFRPDEEQLLNNSQNLIYVVVTTLLGAGVAVGLEKAKILTLGQSIFEPQHVKMTRPPKSWSRTFSGWQLTVTFVITFIVGLKLTQFSFYELLDESGFQGAQRIFSALVSPEMAVLPRGILAIIETIYIAFMSTVIAIPVAFVLAFFAAKNIMGGSALGLAIYFGIRTILNVTRSIEPLIWAIIFSVWVGIGPFAGMLALMFHSVASLTKQYSEIIESASDGPIEGIRATGANSTQVVWYAIVPQVILPYIAFTIYRWDINVRMATVIGLVGGGGIGTLLIQYQGQALWNEVGTLALLIVIVVWTMDTMSAYIREALK